MNKDKQIDEIAKFICDMEEPCKKCREEYNAVYPSVPCWMREIAKNIYNAGYRKQREGEWISVDERLPDSRKFVLVCDEYGNVGEAYFFKNDGRFEWLDDEERVFATHWMPLPEAPKMKGGMRGSEV